MTEVNWWAGGQKQTNLNQDSEIEKNTDTESTGNVDMGDDPVITLEDVNYFGGEF